MNDDLVARLLALENRMRSFWGDDDGLDPSELSVRTMRLAEADTIAEAIALLSRSCETCRYVDHDEDGEAVCASNPMLGLYCDRFCHGCNAWQPKEGE